MRSSSLFILLICAVAVSARLYSWGDNAYGQLGAGWAASRYLLGSVDHPALVNKTITKITSGFGSHVLVITSDGEVYGWGRNIKGELGDSTTQSYSTAIRINSTLFEGERIIDVAAGREHSLFLTASGRVLACGDNTHGQLGDDTRIERRSPVLVMSDGFVAGKRTVKVVAARSHSLAIAEDGTLYAWGWNSFGQLGDDNQEDSLTPVKVDIPAGKRVIDVSGGRLHTIALTSDNMVYTWGSNKFGQLGDGTTFDHPSPVNISFVHLDPAPGLLKKVVAGKYFSLVLTEAGDLITFGDNSRGQLGDGTVQLGIDPKYMPRTNVLFERFFVDVAVGYEHVIVRTDDARIFSWGRNSFGQLGDSTTTERHLPQPFIIVEHVSHIRFNYIAATLFGSFAKTVNGRLYSCGDNRFGQLGDGSRYVSQPSKPVRVALSNNCGSVISLNVISIDGRDHSVLALSNGRVYAWGQNDLAEIGDGSTINKMSPTETDSTGVLANQRVIKVAAGFDHTLALTDTGRVYAWGNNQEGQLGDGTEVSRVTPVLVDMTSMLGRRVVTIDAGTAHSVAITDDGRLYAWGRNYEGQIGTGSRIPAYTSPTEISMTDELVGKKFVAVNAGSFFTLALTDTNELFAWGDNEHGQLGIGNQLSQSTAVKVESDIFGNKTIVQISGGRRHTMVLTADNLIYAWGSNSMGQLGDGTYDTRTSPTPVNQNGALKNVKISKIDTGYEHSLALAVDGRIYGWGDNEFYQLGVSDRVQIANPIAMPLQGALHNKRVKIIEGGDGHTLVLTRIFVSEVRDYIGDTAELLVISGSEFGTTRTAVSVELSQGTCAVRSVTENNITCVVSGLTVGPLYARVTVLDEDSGDPVQVRTVVPAPSITPSSSIITQDATMLTIYGQGFDPTSKLNTVTLFLGRQSMDCAVINGTATQLTCEMQEELGSLGTLMAQVKSFSATSTQVAVAEVTLPVWGLILVLFGAAGCTAIAIFFGVRYYRSVKQMKRFEEWQANFQSKYVVPRNEIFPPVVLEWIQPETSVNTPLDDFPVRFSRSHLDFGNSGYPFRLNVTYKDSITLQLKRLVAKSKPTKGTHATMLALEEIGSDLKESLLASASSKGVRVVFHTPRSHKFKLLMPNNEFVLTKGKEEMAEFDLMVFMTTQCAVPIAIEIPDWNMHTYIELNVVGELSPYIDFDEVKFDKTKMIGDGAFGTVYQGVYRNQQVAVKVLKIQELLPAFMDEYFREIDLLNKLRHPNIVQFVGASTVEGRLAILTEFVELGSAKNYLTDDLELYVRMRIALDTAKAIQFLHQNKIMHRDIKLENLLVVSLDRNAPVVVKLTDFGTSRAIAEELAQRYTMGIGTPIFMAPEMLLKQPYDLKSDIYSFGMLLWTLHNQKEPYETFERTWDVVPFVIQGNREKIPDTCPSDLRTLIENCWDQDPKLRPTIDAVVMRLEAFVSSLK